VERLPERVMGNEKDIIEWLFSEADITVDGDNDFDPQVHNSRFYKRVLQEKSLGLGEAYPRKEKTSYGRLCSPSGGVPGDTSQFGNILRLHFDPFIPTCYDMS
jgi:hypothetical protein